MFQACVVVSRHLSGLFSSHAEWRMCLFLDACRASFVALAERVVSRFRAVARFVRRSCAVLLSVVSSCTVTIHVIAQLKGCLWSGGMAADGGAALVDAGLLVRPRSYSGNSQEWNAFKFVFKSKIGVVAHPMLAMIHAETLNEPIVISGLSPEDAPLSRSLSFLLAQVFVWTSSATHVERGIKMDWKRGDCWYTQNSPCPERTGLRQ